MSSLSSEGIRRIIDAHVHVGKEGLLPWRWSRNSFVEKMQSANIEKAVIMPEPPLRDKPSDEIFTDDWNDPFFYRLLMIDPYHISWTKNMIETHLDRISGFKYHPSYYDCEISNEMLKSLWPLVQELKLPVLVHCGRHMKSGINSVITVAKRWPSIIFVAAHLGGMVTDKVVKAIHAVAESGLKNICMDTSGVQYPQLLKLTEDLIGDERIIFGSDEPYCSYELAVRCVELAGFNEESMMMVMAYNAERIYGRLV